MTPAALKALILAQSDGSPIRLAYTRGDAECAAALNEPGEYPVVTPMRVGDFANWLAERGLLRKVHAAQSHGNEQIASAALLLMLKIQGDPSRMVDPADVSIQGMFAAFVAAALVSAGDVTAFTTACTGVGSFAESHLGKTVSANDIANARVA